MSTHRITVDALSRALCPAIDAALLSGPFPPSLLSPNRTPLTCQRQARGRRPSCRGNQARAVHTSSPTGFQSAQQQQALRLSEDKTHPAETQASGKKAKPDPWESTAAPPWLSGRPRPMSVAHGAKTRRPTDSDQPVKRWGSDLPGKSVAQDPEPTDQPGAIRKLIRRPTRSSVTKPNNKLPFQWEELGLQTSMIHEETDGARGASKPLPESVQRMAQQPISTVYKTLRDLWSDRGASDSIRHVVKHLVEERGERPNPLMYEALVAANSSTTAGNGAALAEMIKEMKTAKMEFSTGFYHAALRLLAVHPNYLLRNTILWEMSSKGLDLKDEGKYSVALGLLRDGQVEMALDYWDRMRQEGTNIPNWVSEIFIYVLVMRGFLNEGLELFRQTLNETQNTATPLSSVVRYYLLDEYSRNMHYEGTTFVWDEMVQRQKLNPSDGTVLNVLNTAARYGDAALATAAIELLAGRQVKLGLHHYEPLLESYVQVKDVENALRVLCVMADVGFQPDQSSTRSIYQMLKHSPELTDEAVQVLRDLAADHEVPAAAINVLLEALIKTQPMSHTLETYRALSGVCKSGPNQQTFALLLAECTTSEHAAALVAEMDVFSVRPTPAILDDLIRCFARDGSLDTALMYLAELGQFPPPARWVSERNLRAVLARCYAEKDHRAANLVEEAKRRGVDVGKLPEKEKAAATTAAEVPASQGEEA